jgi:hypothetical protein
MEWVEFIGYLVGFVLDCAIWASREGGAGSADTARGDRRKPTGEVPPLAAEALARCVPRTSTREVRGGGSFRSSRESPDPLWDRELDG